MVIWKYPVAIAGRFEVVLPVGAEFLDVQTQFNAPVMWFKVKEKDHQEKRIFFSVPTGESMLPSFFDELKYLGTFQLSRGELVFHLFEETR